MAVLAAALQYGFNVSVKGDFLRLGSRHRQRHPSKGC